MPPDKKIEDAYEKQFSKLPEPYDSMAKQRRKERPLYQNIPGDIATALFDGFVWRETPEGHAFWENVRNCIIKGKLKNLPRKDSHGRSIANWTQAA